MSRCMIGPKFREEDLTAPQPEDEVPSIQCEERAIHRVDIRLGSAIAKAGEPDRVRVKLCDIHFYNLGVHMCGKPTFRGVVHVTATRNGKVIEAQMTFKGNRKTMRGT